VKKGLTQKNRISPIYAIHMQIFAINSSCRLKRHHLFVRINGSGANLINILAAFPEAACILIFSGTFLESYKKFKCLDFLPGAQKKLPALGHIISSYGYI